MMNFTQSVRTCLFEKYARFEGRASRSEFWWFCLFMTLLLILAGSFFMIAGGSNWIHDVRIASKFGYEFPNLPIFTAIIGILAGLIWLVLIIPSLSATVRRFHDRGLSGWWVVAYIFVSVIPILGSIAGLVVMVVCALRGTQGDNKYGADPLI